MEKGMEKEKNMKILNYYLVENIYMEKDGKEKDLTKKVQHLLKLKMEKEKE